MQYHVSYDGDDWQPVSREELQRIVEDATHRDCWIAADGEGMLRMTLAAFRNLMSATPAPVDKHGRPTELYGIPIVWEDGYAR